MPSCPPPASGWGSFRLQTQDGDVLEVESTWSLVLGPEGRPRTILMGADLLRLSGCDADGLRIIDNIEAGARRGSALVRQLVACARGGEGEHTDLKLAEVVEEVRKILAQDLGAGIKLEISCAAPARAIRADATRSSRCCSTFASKAAMGCPKAGGSASRWIM